MSGRQQRVMVQPIVSMSYQYYTLLVSLLCLQNVIFKNLQQVNISTFELDTHRNLNAF